MSFYEINLAVFAAGNGYLLYRQYQRSRPDGHYGVANGTGAANEAEGATETGAGPDSELLAGESKDDMREVVRRFKLDYFVVYGLAVAADWLQVRRPSQLTNSLEVSS
jgi:hypothetical protein